MVSENALTIQFSVPMNQEMYKLISEESEKLGISKSEFVRRCITSYICSKKPTECKKSTQK